MMPRMRLSALALALLLTSPAVAKKAKPPTGPSPIAASRQLVLVTASGWDTAAAQLQRYQRARAGGAWSKVGKKITVAVGKSGMAWGIGLHGAAPAPPVKREGDMKSPAGAFALSSAFGYQPKGAGVKMPYLQLTQSIECVDDGSSAHYNQLVDKKQVKPQDWTSGEHMNRADDLYRLGVVVDHNSGTPVANGGSCVFLHIRGRDASTTAGCTALDAKDMEEVLAWLDPDAKPSLVQLPDADARRLRAAWTLP